MKYIKSLNKLATILMFTVPLTTISCNWIELSKGSIHQTYINDFSFSNIDSGDIFGRNNQWNEIWMAEMENKGYEKLEYHTVYSDGVSFIHDALGRNKFNTISVENLLSSSLNFGEGVAQPKNDSLSVHQTVSIVGDTDSAVMSILANEGFLKDIRYLNLTSNINTNIYDQAIENSSMEVNGIKEQIGIPYNFQLQGITMDSFIGDEINEYYYAGEFEELTIAGKKISNISVNNSVGPFLELQSYIQENGWTWNEMIAFGSKIESLINANEELARDKYQLFSDYRTRMENTGAKLETFISAKRYQTSGDLLWDGVSKDWNSDILTTLSSQNSSSIKDVEEAISKMMELIASSSDVESIKSDVLDPIFFVSSSSESNYLLPMPIYTNNGNDVYNDLVVNSDTFFLPDDEQFYTSEVGVNFRDDVIETLIYQEIDGKPIKNGISFNPSPYISTEQMTHQRGFSPAHDKLIDILLSDASDHSMSSSRWMADWFRGTLENSVTWTDGAGDERIFKFNFKPIESVNRDVNLYDKYDLNIE